MIHLPDLLRDLALILGAAGVVTLLFKWLRQPVVLGYILAGLFVGPHFPIFPTVRDSQGVHIWAEAGVIFLLFGLGLEFSFRKLARVGAPATVTGLCEIVLMLGVGTLAGRFMGWSMMDSLFLGGILSVSSTTIIIRAFEELNLKRQSFARLVFGVLIVEDLVAILLLVLLTTVAVTQTLQGAALLSSVLKLTFFLILWFLGGIFLVPSVLRRVRGQLSEETTVIVSVALCLLMVLFATEVGFSPALGAFIMGSILAETPEAERIEHLTRPVKDLFAAVFFVSVGMLIDPRVLVDYAGPIGIITVLTIVGKIASTSLGALIAGRPLKQSIRAGFSLAQIGEFSFIIATLGLSLKVTSEFLYPIAVAVSAITTFTTPYLIRYSEHSYDFIEKRIPAHWQLALTKYQAGFASLSNQETWRTVLRGLGTRMLLNAVVVIAIFLAIGHFSEALTPERIEGRLLARALLSALALLISAPFLWAMALGGLRPSQIERLKGDHEHRIPMIVIQMLRIVVSLILLAVLLGRLTSASFGVLIAIAGIIAMALLVSGRLERAYEWMEEKFLVNLTAREENEDVRPPLAPWDAHLVELVVESNAPCVGQTLMELKVREEFGVTIALIERGRHRITAPGRFERLFPGDQLAVIGADDQLQRFQSIVREPSASAQESANGSGDDYGLERIELTAALGLSGKTIRDSGLRERTKGLVVGVERKGQRMLNPDSTLVLQEDDVLWIVGDPLSIKALRSSST